MSNSLSQNGADHYFLLGVPTMQSPALQGFGGSTGTLSRSPLLAGRFAVLAK
jgi:hypothetical protein